MEVPPNLPELDSREVRVGVWGSLIVAVCGSGCCDLLQVIWTEISLHYVFLVWFFGTWLKGLNGWQVHLVLEYCYPGSRLVSFKGFSVWGCKTLLSSPQAIK